MLSSSQNIVNKTSIQEEERHALLVVNVLQVLRIFITQHTQKYKLPH